MAVDLFGLTADYDRINTIAKRHGLFVIEDAAQAFGAENLGRKACGLTDLACTSFFPAKPLGAYGDGGMCFTDDDHWCEILRSLRIHGQGKDKYENIRIGLNGRLDTLQAAILLAKFEIFPEEIELRQKLAQRYSELLSPFSSAVSLPTMPHGYRSAWAPIFSFSAIWTASGAVAEKSKPGGYSHGHLLSETASSSEGPGLSGI
jgi:UDP-2-acetamido-2-deoxy-ribo-hexuluronate aminotransferase